MREIRHWLAGGQTLNVGRRPESGHRGYPSVITSRVLIVGEHSLVNLGLTTLLSGQATFKVLAELTPDQAVATTSVRRPDLVILDIDSSKVDGLQVCADLCLLPCQPAVVILTGTPDETLVTRAAQVGAAGFVLKQAHASELLEHLRLVQDGHWLRDTAQHQAVIETVRRAARAADPTAFATLTPQERHILLLVSEGRTNHEIAQALQLGEGTVRNYISHILEKLGCANRTEAAAFAVAHRLSDIWPES